MKNLRLRLTLLALGFAIAGCATNRPYALRVDALSDAELAREPVEAATFRVIPDEPAEGGLRWAEAAGYVRHLLERSGYRQVAEGEEPDILVQASAEVTGPRSMSVTRSEPLHIRTYGTYQTVRTPVYDKDGRLVRFAYSSVYVPPQSDFGGWVNTERTLLVYEKRLSLTARENDGTATGGREWWTLTVSALDVDGDLRKSLPVLAAGALPYIGKQTDGEVTVEVPRDDPRIAAARADAR